MDKPKYELKIYKPANGRDEVHKVLGISDERAEEFSGILANTLSASPTFTDAYQEILNHCTNINEVVFAMTSTGNILGTLKASKEAENGTDPVTGFLDKLMGRKTKVERTTSQVKIELAMNKYETLDEAKADVLDQLKKADAPLHMYEDVMKSVERSWEEYLFDKELQKLREQSGTEGTV